MPLLSPAVDVSPSARRIWLAATLAGFLATPPAAAGPCLTCTSGAGSFPLGWWHDRPVTPATGDAHAPRIDVDEWSPRVHAALVWEERSGGDGDILLALSDDRGCTWSSRPLTGGSDDDRLPDVALSTGLDVVAVAFVRAGAVQVVASADAGTSFSPPERVHPTAGIDPGTAPRLAAVAIAGSVHLHLVWTAGGALYHARSVTGGAPGSWLSGPPLSDRFAGWSAWSGADVQADTRSRSPGTESGVTIAGAALGPGRSASEVWAVRSGDGGATFSGDPIDPATLDRPAQVSDPRPDDPALAAVAPALDGSDDASGAFYVWQVAAWTDFRNGEAEPRADGRAEEGVSPSLIADWNRPPASGDVSCATPPARAAGLAVVPNPLDRPPTPDVHVFHQSLAASGEIEACRGVLDRRALPTVDLHCGPYGLTGLYPAPRTGGAVEAGSLAADEDLSHVFVVWSDDRDGASRIYFKRTDTATAPPTAVQAETGACAAGGGIRVRWTPPPAPPNCDLDLVRVEHGPTSGNYTGAVDVRGASETILGGLVAGARYFIRVTAVDEACNTGSALEVTALAADCSGTVLCPNPVGNSLLAVRDRTDVRLSWQAPAADATHGAATSYDIHRAVAAPGSGYALVGNLPVLAFTDPAAAPPGSPGDRHFYRVVARNACGTSGDVPPP